ncbi:MAG TPA: hypothetical protein PKH97_02320 [Tetrasphaera sp.]|uniref:hypothetical protein n=1 Tax=Nostocoides sp. TaxID=1917966 RepID=UPI002C274340|nr:hypothetical protein [Tetrasphaera sp.]HNQ06003.1 hypothetical protein [Tetrasphaera sp.]
MGQGFGRIVTIVLLIGLLASFLALIFGDSTRSRADRLANFTRRQGVKVTATSAPYVSNALARSRFWRRAGLVLAFVSGAGVRMPFGATHDADTPRAQWLVLFGGWLLGLIIAEWRAAGTAGNGAHRGASLTARRFGDYVSRSARVWPLVSGLIALGTGVWLAVRVATDREAAATSDIGRTGLIVLGVAALAGALLVVTGRRIVRRPQAGGDDDLRLADDLLRSRSLQLLCGGAVACASFIGAAFLALVGRTVDVPPDGMGGTLANVGGFGVFLAVFGAAAGIALGTTATPVPHASVPAAEPVEEPAG